MKTFASLAAAAFALVAGAGRECAGPGHAAVSNLDRPTGHNGDKGDTTVRRAGR
jgi:hypothetical protein